MSTQSSWIADLETAVVAALNADANLTALCGKIEVGMVLPQKVQEINQPERPYFGWKYLSHTGDLGRADGAAVGYSIHDVTLRGDLQHAAGQQADLESTLKAILAQTQITLGLQRVANPFQVRFDPYWLSVNIVPGGGAISRIAEPPDDSDEWIGEAEYEFKVRMKFKTGTVF